MDNEKNGYKIMLFVAVVIVVFCSSVFLLGKPSKSVGVSDLQNDTNRTMADAKQQYEFVGSEVVVVADRINDAEQSNKGAEEIAYRLNGGIKQNEERLARCTSIVIECRELVEANRAILQDAGK